ncbi:MAG: carbon-nitrogen hydrolase [Candidatus Binatia bacterium]|nr:MAG: carbon-nitrogen hydrolase [Candidatus Binatia bacterium]
MPTFFRIVAAQLTPRLGDVAANLALYEAEIERAVRDGVDVLVFPELSLTGYFLKDMVSEVALRLESAEVRRLREASRHVALVAGFVEEAPDFRYYNSAVYFEDGEIRHVHRKVYLPTYGLFDEGRYLARGNRIRSFPTKFGRFAILICEDLWHPSTIYIAALDGAVVVVCPSSSPLRGISDGAVQDDNARYWEALNRIYAQTYSVYLVYANRVGFEDGVGFWGGSEIVAPDGTTVAKGPYYEPATVGGEIDLARVRHHRVIAPVIRDEDLDLTINELLRIRGRPREGGELPAEALEKAHAEARKTKGGEVREGKGVEGRGTGSVEDRAEEDRAAGTTRPKPRARRRVAAGRSK